MTKIPDCVLEDMMDVVRRVSLEYGVEPEALLSSCREYSHWSYRSMRDECASELRENGYTYADIGHLFGRDRTHIYQWVKRHTAPGVKGD